MTTRGADHYSNLSAEYLRRARGYLAEEDLTQASEKGWGAAAVAVKACAESRGLPHTRHRHLWETIRLLVRETGDAELRRLFPYAESLHGNFYEDQLEREDVADLLRLVTRLVEKLDGLVQPARDDA